MAIDLKKNRLRIHKSTLREMGSPEFVRLLFSPERGAIGVVTGSSEIPKAEEIRVIYDKPNEAGTFDIYSKYLVSVIRMAFRGLDQTGLYRLKGTPVPEENGVYFPLSTLTRAEDSHV
uniref:Uncharacterized protein n=1 Tax=uncultured bacterium Contigcl_1542 TaxID=1393651 RepID=W0FSP7_9BACT|nr:hypothetical protein [uncultured bacterium Contigcl_1542]